MCSRGESGSGCGARCTTTLTLVLLMGEPLAGCAATGARTHEASPLASVGREDAQIGIVALERGQVSGHGLLHRSVHPVNVDVLIVELTP